MYALLKIEIKIANGGATRILNYVGKNMYGTSTPHMT